MKRHVYIYGSNAFNAKFSKAPVETKTKNGGGVMRSIGSRRSRARRMRGRRNPVHLPSSKSRNAETTARGNPVAHRDVRTIKPVSANAKVPDGSNANRLDGATSNVKSELTRHQIWELMMFFRFPFAEAAACSKARAEELLGQVSNVEKSRLIKMAKNGGGGSSSSAAQSNKVEDRKDLKKIAVKRASKTSPPASRRPKSSSTKTLTNRKKCRFSVAVRFHLLLDALDTSDVDVKMVEIKKTLLKQFAANGAKIDRSTLKQGKATKVRT